MAEPAPASQLYMPMSLPVVDISARALVGRCLVDEIRRPVGDASDGAPEVHSPGG
jgi:hypothetical protein